MKVSLVLAGGERHYFFSLHFRLLEFGALPSLQILAVLECPFLKGAERAQVLCWERGCYPEVTVTLDTNLKFPATS